MQKEITIIGAGLVGSLLSIYLSKQGYKVKIYERRPDMRKMSMSAGRSINLALSDRGIKALEEVGIMDEIRKIAIPMHGRQMHHVDGTSGYQPYGKEGQFINSVSRGELNKTLMDLAEAHQVEIHFNEKCDHIDWKKNEIHFTNTATNTTHSTHQDLIFGSDGAFSAARLSHQLQHDRFQYQQFYIDFGYKELTIPAGENGTFLLEKIAGVRYRLAKVRRGFKSWGYGVDSRRSFTDLSGFAGPINGALRVTVRVAQRAFFSVRSSLSVHGQGYALD